MSWIDIFILTAKWATAVWAGLLAAAMLGCLVLAVIFAAGGWLTGAEPLWERPAPRSRS